MKQKHAYINTKEKQIMQKKNTILFYLQFSNNINRLPIISNRIKDN